MPLKLHRHANKENLSDRITHLFTDFDMTFMHWNIATETDLDPSDTKENEANGFILSSTIIGTAMLKACGIQTVLCTGRLKSETSPVLDTVKIHWSDSDSFPHVPFNKDHFQGGIYGDGHFIYDEDGKLFPTSYLSPDQLLVSLQILDQFVISVAEKWGSAPMISFVTENERVILNDPLNLLTDRYLYEGLLPCKESATRIIEYMKCQKLGGLLDSLIELLPSDALKPNMTLIDFAPFLSLYSIVNFDIYCPTDIRNETKMLTDRIPQEQKGTLVSKQLYARGICLGMGTGDKGSAIQNLTKVDKNLGQFCVIGDGHNDTFMFKLKDELNGQCVDAFVMGNASPSVKACGSVIVSDSDRHGWFEAAQTICQYNLKWAKAINETNTEEDQNMALQILESTSRFQSDGLLK